MCKTTKGTQAAANAGVLGIQPNAASGGGVVTPQPPPPPANQFDGFQEHVPDRVFVSTAGTPGFLTSANAFYTYFGLQPQSVTSIENLLELLGDPALTTTYQRLLLVSHAHPRGVIMPFFTGGVNGTNKEVFREFAKSDLDGLIYLSPFARPIFNWDSVLTMNMANLRTLIALPANAQFANVLVPFGLQSTNPPHGDLRQFFEWCFEYVFVGTTGRVKNQSNASISPAQRNICKSFFDAIIKQVAKKIKDTTINGTLITDAHLSQLQNAITSLNINDLNVGSFNYSLSDYNSTNMNYYPTLEHAARAVNANYRANLMRARQRLTPTSTIDIRGCRAGDENDYLVALREFFDRPENPRLKASAPRWFQSYSSLGWERPQNRADIAGYLTRSIFANAVPPAEQRTAITYWAGLLKVDTLHSNFFAPLLGGPAAAFCDLTWRTRVPALFIPTPGIAALAPLDFPALITKLRDFFNVPAAAMPSASQLTAIAPMLASMTAYNQSLSAAVPAGTTNAQLTVLYNGLKQINTALAQALVPATAPSPLTVNHITQYQQALNDYLDTNTLAPIKTFMTAANNTLTTGDGLYFYMLFAGLPVFFFNRFAMNHNGLMVLQAFENAALQSWYKCIWAEPLPSGAANASTGAAINQGNARRVPTLQDEHVLTELAMCPSDKYEDHLEFSQ